MTPSAAEAAFLLGCRERGLPTPVEQHRFALSIGREWRFDFAWPNHPLPRLPTMRLAVEIEGLTGGAGGRHQRVGGFREDCEKYEAALSLGWLLYRVPASWAWKKRGRNGIVMPRAETLDVIAALLDGTLPKAHEGRAKS